MKTCFISVCLITITLFQISLYGQTTEEKEALYIALIENDRMIKD